ncbi:hypothetical protein J6590_096784 [Homalodisca vitripennis]|nr:hypothetical protein J6590_096784 [Homalodisca vitripennis]
MRPVAGGPEGFQTVPFYPAPAQHKAYEGTSMPALSRRYLPNNIITTTNSSHWVYGPVNILIINHNNQQTLVLLKLSPSPLLSIVLSRRYLPNNIITTTNSSHWVYGPVNILIINHNNQQTLVLLKLSPSPLLLIVLYFTDRSRRYLPNNISTTTNSSH